MLGSILRIGYKKTPLGSESVFDEIEGESRNTFVSAERELQNKIKCPNNLPKYGILWPVEPIF